MFLSMWVIEAIDGRRLTNGLEGPSRYRDVQCKILFKIFLIVSLLKVMGPIKLYASHPKKYKIT